MAPRHLRRFVTLAVTLLAACSATPRGREARKPNVIVIMTDDQGYGDLSCHGNPWLKTPHLDRLHQDSVRLTNFHVSPLCSPTRASLLTGRHARHVGVQGTNSCTNLIDRNVPTVGDVFAANGYRTGVFGKWHLGEHYPYRPQDRGFHESVVHGNGAITTNGDIWGNDYYDDTYWHNGQRQQYEGYCTDVWFRLAMDFIGEAGDQPFFCYLPTNAAHGPYIVPEKYARPYVDNENVYNANFLGMLANIDENVGRLLQFLESSALAENTILIFMTDNGSTAGCRFRDGKLTIGYNAGMRGRKGSAYDGGHRVPFFVRWPKGNLSGGRDVDGLAAHLDLLPTLIDLCGLQAPANMKLDGVTLRPRLAGKTDTRMDRTLVESFRGIVMTERWRLVEGRELYDIQVDPDQQNDIASSHPEVVARLRAALEENRGRNDLRKQRVVIGSEHEDPVEFTPEHWQDLHTPWPRERILKGEAINGPVLVDVERAGTFEFALRRWPAEVNQPIRAAAAGGEAKDIVRARLKVDRFDQTREVTDRMSAATFQVPLEAGNATIETWLTTAQGESSGAYFVSVKRL